MNALLTCVALVSLGQVQNGGGQTKSTPLIKVKQQGQTAQPALDREAVLKLKGQPFPAFKMTKLDDKNMTNKDLLGKVTVIDFWATWCGPCKAAAPKLEAMFGEYKSKGFQIIGANAGERNGAERVYTKDNAVAYVKEHKYTYTFTYNNDALFKQLQCWGYPTFFVIDKKGVVAEVSVGFNEQAIRAAVEAAL